MLDIFNLKGKNILVTGSSSGIGKSIAINSAKSGANVILTGRNEKKLNEVIQTIDNKNCSYIVADLAKENDIIELAKNITQLDGIVFNAGLLKTMPVKFTKKDNLEEIFSVNTYSSILLAKYLLKKKKIKNGASICFISSIASKKMTIGNATYSASKGAINSFSKSLALELAPKKIRVNAVLPGMIKTNILEKSAITADNLDNHINNYPIGRFGQPEDIAYLIIYLMSDASSFMTGSHLTIDGGYSIK